ncbi:MAG TPA: hypothetical protein VKA60_09775 [Blastocatellia bacterium]|nr:hypothetical protein [Blastocatellia bacterium]
MVTVKVVWRSSGKPARDQKVALEISSFFSGGVTSGKWTDYNGEAHFDVKPSAGRVFVNGQTRYSGYLSGRVVVYI